MPGHTSGSICLYERSRALIVTGDTVLARGTLSVVTQNGSSGEHLESLERLASLRARLLLPGHGPLSDDPAADIAGRCGDRPEPAQQPGRRAVRSHSRAARTRSALP